MIFFQVEIRQMSVAPTQEYLNEAIGLLWHGAPVGKDYWSTWMAMLSERARRILKIHPGKNNF
jgi:hypothetical protein